jgi:exosome complex component RRP46
MSEFVREDGRSSYELRACDSEQSMLSRADGSARLKQGATDVICAVFGPMQPKRSKDERVDRATVEVVVRPSFGTVGPKERELERFVRQSFEKALMASLHPRTSIRIVLQCVKDDGSLFAALMNCTTLALLDAGVEMRAPVVSAVCALSADGRELLDPCAAETDADGAAIVDWAAMLPEGEAAPATLALRTTGALTEAQLEACIAAARRSAPTVAAFFRLALQQKYAGAA